MKITEACAKCGTRNSQKWARGLCRSCYNHHHHAGTVHAYPLSPQGPDNYGQPIANAVHGISNTYFTKGCRCEPCTRAASRYSIFRQEVRRFIASNRRAGFTPDGVQWAQYCLDLYRRVQQVTA